MQSTASRNPQLQDASPPAYESLPKTSENPLGIERKWDDEIPTDWNTKRRPNLVFHCDSIAFFPPRPFRGNTGPRWRACLRVWAKNIPRLMRTGFHCSSAHLITGQGRMFMNSRWKPRSCGHSFRWRHTREFAFKDLGPDPQWKAELWVMSMDRSVLPTFDLQLVTKNLFSRQWRMIGAVPQCILRTRYFLLRAIIYFQVKCQLLAGGLKWRTDIFRLDVGSRGRVCSTRTFNLCLTSFPWRRNEVRCEVASDPGIWLGKY